MSGPAVTVLMAVRDGAAHLAETVASLRAMHAPPRGLEFVVIDDASRDATGAILGNWAAADPRLRVETAPAPMGLPAALNRGLGLARGALVARADADDLYAPDRIVRQATAFADDPALGLLSCGYVRIRPDGTEIDRVVPPTGHDVLAFRMLFMNPFLHPGAMFRTDAVRRVGGYDTAYWTAQDSDLWARLAGTVAMDNLTEPLVRYRVHDGSVMRRRGPEGQALSLTVPARLQAAYLAPAPLGHDVAATAALFQGFAPMAPAALRAGLAGLGVIVAAAVGREPDGVMRDFAQRLDWSLSRHARWNRARHPLLALTLARAARHWRRRLAELSDPARHDRPARHRSAS